MPGKCSFFECSDLFVTLFHFWSKIVVSISFVYNFVVSAEKMGY